MTRAGIYLDDGRTLKNRLGATTEDELARLETDAVRHRFVERRIIRT